MNYFTEDNLPEYVIHTDNKVCGFCGLFRFLSNFFPCSIFHEGLWYPSVEAAYQASKWPQNKRDEFTRITAGQSKRIGKKAPDFDKIKWDKNKVKLMSLLVLQKFENNPDLKAMLKATGDAYLEETNSWGDTFWGRNEDGEGENNLGKILMAVRKTI